MNVGSVRDGNGSTGRDFGEDHSIQSAGRVVCEFVHPSRIITDSKAKAECHSRRENSLKMMR